MGTGKSVIVGVGIAGQSEVALIDNQGHILHRCPIKTLRGRSIAATLDPYLRAIEEMLFREPTSETALRSLILLAEAENETWSNNATGVVQEAYFPIHAQRPLRLTARPLASHRGSMRTPTCPRVCRRTESVPVTRCVPWIPLSPHPSPSRIPRSCISVAALSCLPASTSPPWNSPALTSSPPHASPLPGSGVRYSPGGAPLPTCLAPVALRTPGC